MGFRCFYKKAFVILFLLTFVLEILFIFQKKLSMIVHTIKKTDSFLLDFLMTQKIFEQEILVSEKKQNGIFLTNGVATIDSILSVIDFSTVLDKKILEPACGQGIFLLSIISKVYALHPNQDIIKHFIANALIFNDIDAKMVDKTIENIEKLYYYLFNEPYTGIFQGYVSDFTLRNRNKGEILLFSTQNEVVLSSFYNKIDYIIGNPPYISLYGRRDKKQNEQQRIDYLQNYNQFPTHVQNGKINLVMLFLEHALDFLKPQQKMSFIIDVAFFETAYQYTRHFLLQNTAIERIVLNIKDFEVASGQIILQIAKNTQNKDNIVCIEDEKTKKTYFIAQKEWNKPNDEFKFRFNGDSTSAQIIEIIHHKKDKTVLAVYPNKNLRTCTMLLDMENKFTIDKSEIRIDGDCPQYPYYQGSKSLSEKYGNFKFEKIFLYNKPLQDDINAALKIELEQQGIKNKKRIGMGETIIYENPKLFIRQSAKELIASIDMGKSAANNSLYIFSLRNNSTHSIFVLKFLCGWLNSDLMTFYAQQQNIIRFAQGKQPQIKISDLGTIPFPRDFDFQEKIVSIVEKISIDCADKKTLQHEIDQLVYQYYALTEAQITHFKQSIKDF
jgi:hypothetical protein